MTPSIEATCDAVSQLDEPAIEWQIIEEDPDRVHPSYRLRRGRSGRHLDRYMEACPGISADLKMACSGTRPPGFGTAVFTTTRATTPAVGNALGGEWQWSRRLAPVALPASRLTPD